MARGFAAQDILMKASIALVFLFLSLGFAQATQAAEIHVMSGGAVQGALKVLTPQYEAQSGDKVIYDFAVIETIRKRLDTGESADVVLLPRNVIDAYIATGRMRADSPASLGTVGTVLVVKEGAPKPDISTPDAFKKTLLAAKSIAFSTSRTPSGAHMAHVLDELGIAGDVKGKLILQPALEGGVAHVVSGDAEIGIYPESEVAPVKGITVVASLPAPYELNAIYTAAVPNANNAPGPAQAFIKFLADPANRGVWKSAGFTPPTP